MKVDHRELPICNEFFAAVVPSQDTDEFFNKPDMTCCVLITFLSEANWQKCRRMVHNSDIGKTYQGL
jgi:hypothetical protein